MKTILRLLGFLKSLIGEVLLSILLGVSAVGAGIGLLGTSAYLISAAALHPSIAELQVAIVGVRFFGISRAVFRYLERLVSHSVNLRILARLREWFYLRVESAPPADMITFRSGDLLNRVMADLETLENFYVRVVSPVVVAVVISLTMSLFIGHYSPQLGWILFTGLVLNGFLLPLLTIFLTRKTGSQLVHERSELSTKMVEWLQGVEVLQSNRVASLWLNELKQKSISVGKIQTHLAFWNGISSGMNLLILNLTILGLLIVTVSVIRSSGLEGVLLAVILLLGMASFESVQALPQAAVVFNASLQAADRIFSVASGKEDRLNALSIDPDWVPASLRFQGVSAKFPEGSFNLQNISFTLSRGETLAIVGHSGAGKTSLINLILRFLDPTLGSIFLDQYDIQEMDPYQVRKYFAVVSQNVKLFSANLRENLLLANTHATDEMLLQVLSQVELEEWFSHLPDGLDTWIGDQGHKLSGGERQRLAVARALLQDRPFLLLDEPVEHLDKRTADKLLASVFQLFNSRGILWVSHDHPSTCLASKMITLGSGQIVPNNYKRDQIDTKDE